MDYQPVAVALKFGFIAVLYLFLLWIARSSLKDLRRSSVPGLVESGAGGEPIEGPGPEPLDAWIVVMQGGGLQPGERFDLFGGISIGRGSEADVRISDRYASAIHARVYERNGVHFVEDLNSTNGTFLNSEPLKGEAELGPDDVIRIGDTELRYEVA